MRCFDSYGANQDKKHITWLSCSTTIDSHNFTEYQYYSFTQVAKAMNSDELLGLCDAKMVG